MVEERIYEALEIHGPCVIHRRTFLHST
jgi:hypothetical protein